MVVNQIGTGGVQNVDLYRQNQDNPVQPGREPGKKLESSEVGKGVIVTLSQESVRLAHQDQERGIERKTGQHDQRIEEPQAHQAGGNGQTKSANTFAQATIDLFT